MDTRTLKKIYQKLSEEDKTELKSEKVELGKVDDIKKLLQDGEEQLKSARNKLNTIKKEISKGLIIVDFNVPAQAKNALKIAEDLGAESVIQDLKSIIDKADKLKKEFAPLYKSID